MHHHNTQHKKVSGKRIILFVAPLLLWIGGLLFWYRWYRPLKLTLSEERTKTAMLNRELEELRESIPDQQPTVPEPKLQKHEEEKQLEAAGYELVHGRCTEEQCLFNMNQSDYPMGVSTIRGFYTQVQRSAWGEEKTCDDFVVLGGSSELIRALVHLVDIGNTVHSKNKYGQPVINLDLEALNEYERGRIKASTFESPIELVVLRPRPQETGVPACFAEVKILRVK